MEATVSNDDWKPEGLGQRGSAFWDMIASEYTLRPDELQLLADAAFEVDIIYRLQVAFATRDLVSIGSMKQEVADPVGQELRQHRTVLKALLAQLRLPDEEGGKGSGDSGSESGRALANQRWRPRSAG
jgi:hypothetical protein